MTWDNFCGEFQRRGTEAWSGWQQRVGPGLQRVRVPGADGRDLGVIQPSGTAGLPRGLQARFDAVEAVDHPVVWPEGRLFELPDATLMGACGSVFTASGKLFEACHWAQRHPDHRVRRPLALFHQDIPGRLFPLMGRNRENHGHFLFEYLPRLVAAEGLLKASGGFRIGIAAKHQPWQRRYLELLGYGSDTVVAVPPVTNRLGAALVAPLLSGPNRLCDTATLRSLFQRLQRGAERLAPELAAPPEPARVAFISRADAPDKRCLNEAELVALARGIFPQVEVLTLSGMPFARQLSLMARAQIIIGAQGMGLSNLVFVRDRIAVCLESNDSATKPGWALSYLLFAAVAGNEGLLLHSTEGRDARRNWSYPPDKFRQELLRLRALLKG